MAAGLAAGLLAGLINGSLIAYTRIPPFIATLGMMVTARGIAKWYTRGQPVAFSTESMPRSAPANGRSSSSSSWRIDLPHRAALHRYGKLTYAIGANVQAARVSGINVERHLMQVYAIAGLLSGLAGIVHLGARLTAQAGMGFMYELDAIAMTVIGGTSLSGGVGRITGTVIGMIIFGVITSGFTFLRVDAYYQEIVKGVIIVAAVVADQYRQRRRGAA